MTPLLNLCAAMEALGYRSWIYDDMDGVHLSWGNAIFRCEIGITPHLKNKGVWSYVYHPVMHDYDGDSGWLDDSFPVDRILAVARKATRRP